jgi:hypothetical protein
MAETEPAAPETQETEAPPEETPTPAPEVTEVEPSEGSTPAPEAETAAVSTDPEPGSPRRKRPRESAPPLVVPRLDASFWQQLVVESRATREASRRERFENLMRF